MIQLDQDNKIVIKTGITEKDAYELFLMKNSVLNLISNQNNELIDQAENYWAIALVKLLDVEPEQLCFKKAHSVGDKQ